MFHVLVVLISMTSALNSLEGYYQEQVGVRFGILRELACKMVAVNVGVLLRCSYVWVEENLAVACG